MSAVELIVAAAVGFLGGATGGLVGVGGGVLFVPALVLVLGDSQLHAEATSLLAIILVAALGAWRQAGYGNVRLRDGMVIGLLSPVGVGIGTVVANAVPERALQLAFAAFQLYFAWRLAQRALRVPAAR